MYSDVAGISIEGCCFKDNKDMIFFPGETDRLSIVYGKNGSGKSTMAEGFRKVMGAQTQHELAASLINRNGNIQNIPSTLKQNIHVFDESYIDNNIRIDANGLKTIVLFGSQVDVENDIKTIEAKIRSEEINIEKITEEKNKYNDAKNILSPEFHIEKMKTSLRRSGGWAERDAKIKNYKHNSSVSEKVVVEIGKLKVTTDNTELEEQYKIAQELLSKISDNNVSFPDVISSEAEVTKEENALIKLLAKKVEKPVLTEREKIILATVEKGHQGHIKESERILSCASL